MKVLDFGLAKFTGEQYATDPALSRLATAIGSPQYMAPEQMGNAAMGAPCDVWALGAVLYELVSGHAAFEADGLAEVCVRVLREPPAPLASHGVAVSAALEAVIHRCLQKDPADRYPTMDAMTAALRALGRGASSTPLPGIEPSPDRAPPSKARARSVSKKSATAIKPDAASRVRRVGGAAARSGPKFRTGS